MSTLAYNFASRRCISSPTPYERRARQLARDRRIDCSAEELELRRGQRTKDAAQLEQCRKWERIDALTPASKAKLAVWQAQQIDKMADEAETAADIVEVDLRADNRRIKQIALRDSAEREWMAFNGVATQAQVDAFSKKFASLYIPFERRLDPVTIVPFIQPASEPVPDFIKSSNDFVQGFTPPRYLLDGVLQCGFFYSITAQTGVGKTAVAMSLAAHVSTGRSIGSLEVEQGSVLYLAGENPSDVQMRWLGVTQALKIDPATADVHFLPGVVSLSQSAGALSAEVIRKRLKLSLVVVDTSAAYDESEDENSNSQAGLHARRLRSLTQLPGNPCVIVLCHPTKRAADNDLLPRGGGAFLAEVDGNIALQRADMLLAASVQGKFRGPEFTPIHFELHTVREHPLLKDARGRPIPTVVALPAAAEDRLKTERANRRDEDAILRVLDSTPGANPTDVARALAWTRQDGTLYHVKAKRLLERLGGEKLVEKHRSGWRLTPKGQRELNDMDCQHSNSKL